jgi:hypothetical protein
MKPRISAGNNVIYRCMNASGRMQKANGVGKNRCGQTDVSMWLEKVFQLTRDFSALPDDSARVLLHGGAGVTMPKRGQDKSSQFQFSELVSHASIIHLAGPARIARRCRLRVSFVQLRKKPGV